MATVPKAVFKISGDIKDFAQIDNLFKALKREGIKLMKNWLIEVDVTHTEEEGGG